ncbi:maleylpyruvate isomerase N-terminal domain-containing protein [Streptomyces sp. NBC_00344]|uniref:maleylpyruvate isomerase N-terminal domain-containing protein n=1 Tax=Streptomyces sp. NBC_00344 TaxID=2975720 RepID=UPI002E1AFBE5
MTGTTGIALADIDRLLDEIRGSVARVGAGLDSLTHLQAREPSALPGWSRGHVVTHLARSADVYRWAPGAAAPWSTRPCAPGASFSFRRPASATPAAGWQLPSGLISAPPNRHFPLREPSDAH